MFFLDSRFRAGGWTRRQSIAVALLLVAACMRVTFAEEATSVQPPPPSPEAPPEELNPEAISSRLKLIEASADPNDPNTAAIRELYNQALPLLEAAAKSAAKVGEYERMIGSVADDLKAVQEKLKALPSVPTVEVPEGATVQQLQQKLDEEEKSLEAAKRVCEDFKARATRRVVAQKENAGLVGKASEQLAEVDRQLAAPAGAADPPALALAKRTLLLARRKTLEQEIAGYEKELAAYNATTELFPLRQRLASAELSLAEQRVARWQEIVNRRREEEARLEAERAKAEAQEAGLPPALQAIADANHALTKEAETLAADIKAVTQEDQALDEILGKLHEQFQSSQGRVESVGLTTEVGLLLRTRRANLPDVGQRRRAIRARQETILTVQLRLFELEDQRSQTLERRRNVDVALAGEGAPPAGISQSDLQRASELLQKQEGYLDGLHASYLSYLKMLVDLTENERKLISETEEYATFIDERVFWIRSADLLGAADCRLAVGVLLRVFRPKDWADAGHALVTDALTVVVPFVIALVVFVPWIIGQRRLRVWLARSGELAMRSTTYHIMPTLNSLLLTILITALWPCVLWYLAWRLNAPLRASDFAKAVAWGLSQTAWFVLPLNFIRQMCRCKGLAEAHFGWPRGNALTVRKRLHWFLLFSLPLVFVLGVLEGLGSQRWQDSLGRSAFMALVLLAGLLLHQLLKPAGPVFRHLGSEYGETWLYRFRRLWYALGILVPIILAVLAALGYYYTAEQLAKRLLQTVYLPLGLTVVGAILFRWIMVVRRRLAIDRARGRRPAGRPDAPSPTPAALPVGPPPAQEADLTMISYQARRLVQGFLLVAGIVGIWLIWSEVLPALGILKQIPIWHISLAEVGLTLIIVALTVIATRNVPGLLEIAMLHSLPLDSGARYAITTVSRYAIAIVGLMLACATLGIKWSTVQWLVAAMGVGLGFGLQEIFANFISGLIILFERPIRVGDIVTIDDVTGVVSKIHIRATWVTNWDRKEFIVPNKEFITGRLLNWTLADSINRVVVNVGIAYGSDTERARDLLLGIAQEHPIVLDDPAPFVTFESFGDSTLDFVLRCYLPNLDNRLAVIHELHTTVHQKFGEAGIEIAFPQRDLHLRSGAEVLRDAYRDRPSEEKRDADPPR